MLFSRETDCVLIELICFFSLHLKKSSTEYTFPVLFAFFELERTPLTVFRSCFPGARDMQLFLVFVGLRKRVTDGMQQLVTFPCVLGLGCTHSHVILVETLFLFLFAITGYQIRIYSRFQANELP